MSEASLLLVLLGIALFSGPIGRGSVTPPMVFTGMGLLLSPVGLGVIDISLDNGIVHALAEIMLILDLFTDAARIKLKRLRTDHDVPLRMLLVALPAGTLASRFSEVMHRQRDLFRQSVTSSTA